MNRTILTLLLPGAVIFGLAAAGVWKTDQKYSDTERRILAAKPAVSTEQLLSGTYMKDYEVYRMDQFPLREQFREMKVWLSHSLLGQLDHHGYYQTAGHLSRLEYPMNEARLAQSIRKHEDLYQRYLKDSSCAVYLAIVPDKNYYLAEAGGYPVMDYASYLGQVRSAMPYAEYVDLFAELSLDDYYRTDQHWKQERLKDVAKKLEERMHAEGISDTDYTEKILEYPFYGAYYHQSGLKAAPDTIVWLTNEELEQCIVTSYNTGKPKAASMYDMEKAAGKDPYEMFLSGSDAFLTIENPRVSSGRELVVFRDSFASSLIPLLVHGYQKITLVDLRYVRNEMLGKLMEFGRQDVLFLYSTLTF